MAWYAKRSVEEWLEIVTTWRGSGTSQRGFCRAEGISYSTFSYWLRKTTEAPSGSLVKIGAARDIKPTVTPRSSIVVTAGSLRMELSGEESEAAMAKIFRALGVASCSSIQPRWTSTFERAVRTCAGRSTV